MYKYYVGRELYHHGIIGQKWGIRRYQHEDGSLTPEGYKHWGLKGPHDARAARKAEKQRAKEEKKRLKAQKAGENGKKKSKLKTAAKVLGTAAAVAAGTMLVKKYLNMRMDAAWQKERSQINHDMSIRASIKKAILELEEDVRDRTTHETAVPPFALKKNLTTEDILKGDVVDKSQHDWFKLPQDRDEFRKYRGY
jgi:hypothetical protein